MGRLDSLKRRMRIRLSSKFSQPCVIDHVPVELLELVFRLACSDSGWTGCSLSQVSTRFRAIVRTSRFNSVALSSGRTTQIAQFTSCLIAERERAGSTSQLVQVRHLFLASARRMIRRNHPGAREELAGYQEDVSRLIGIIAPDLHSLLLQSSHIGWEDELRLPDIGLVSYPKLRELSLYGYGSKFAPVSPFPTWDGLDSLAGTEDLANYPQLPSLSRLHITCDPRYVWTRNPNLRHWAERAPGLTHLCLANWKQYHLFIAATVADVIGLPDRSPLFQHLRVFVVQADASPTLPQGSAPFDFDTVAELAISLEELRDLHRASARQWALVPPMLPFSDRNQEYEQAAKQEWACWEAGLPGCWAVDDLYLNLT
ncbi:hypothetical protein L226DRAFT_608075 [Lentinus tigrinus ALCF2SS1-7]|uniref:F-box domain-containing protein n=1 Tax=Lentinus tigrinus ALCF2SS1-6 TaxID=1328759 RepID=A0A5C2SSE8_9APHY|nr:hypothetical protein L227DRAFT_596745 [Lentinus tigrinus ALCF2SS1-6]RPD80725.1 hypothetical protein L226DRAFT_608075 [Lentinus tigrinus ALCF2SS1-7]